MKNFKIANIDRDALYSVTMTGHYDGSTQTQEMTGAELVSVTNACLHLYDIHAELIPAKPQEPADILRQAGALELTHRVAVYVPGTQGVSAAADNTAQVRKIAAKLSGYFGGATAQQSTGYWTSSTAGLVAEAVTIVFSACTAEQLNAHLPQVLELAQDIKREMQQEAVTVELDGKLYII